MTTEAERSPEQQDLTALSDTLIAEVQNADTIVIGMPMYNFGTPSHFKAWVDHIARAGVTFRYTENGPEGLLIGKRVVVLVASGGIYKGTDNDSLTPYLTTFFNFLGIQQVNFIYAEGLAMGDAETPITLAQTQIKALAATL
jgi:FMN-dependent NADH-azoreductase